MKALVYTQALEVQLLDRPEPELQDGEEIGRASCRERVCSTV